MLVTIRTATGKVYKIEVEDTMTVKDIKDLFAKEAQSGDAPIKFILKGKILQDDEVFSSLNFQPNSFFVAQISRSKPAAPATPAAPPSTPATPAAPAPATTTTTQQPAAPAPATTTTAPPPATSTPSTPSGPSVEPLPLSTPTPSSNRPNIDEIAATPEFAMGVQQLMAMGYPRSDCVAALRSALGNPDLAAEFLITGNVPSEEQVLNRIEQQRNQTAQLRGLIQQNPENLNNIIELMEQNNPQLGAEIRRHPEVFLQQLGLDPSQFDLEAIRSSAGAGGEGDGFGDYGMDDPYGQQYTQPGTGGATSTGGAPQASAGPTMSSFNQILSELTPQEQESVRRLQELGFDLPTALQAFLACDKDENAAANLLFS